MLLKVVAMSIPSYVMQSYLLHVGVCNKLDRVARNFLWGKTGEQRKLHLKACVSLCVPKCSGGFELRRFRDINLAFVTKLAWKVCTDRERPSVQLVRSKYLRGIRVLDFQQTTQSASWIWSGIKQCYDSLRK